MKLWLGIVAAVVLVLALSEPARAQAVTVGTNCRIEWNANAEADVAKYAVTGVLTAAGGTVITKILDVPKQAVATPKMFTTCAAMGLTTGGALSVFVEAVDLLGNRSIKSALATAGQDITAPAQVTGLTITPNP